MDDWIQDAFFKSRQKKIIIAPVDKNDKLKNELTNLTYGYISEFHIIIYGNLITVSFDKFQITVDIVYDNESSLEFIKTTILPDIIKTSKEIKISTESINIKTLHIPDFIKQIVTPRSDINISYTSRSDIYSNHKNKTEASTIYHMNRISQTYTISIKFNLLVCTFSSSLYLYKLANPNQEQIKKALRKFTRPLINLLELLSNKQERVEFALEIIANLNFLTHSKITTNLLTPLAINGFVLFSKNIRISKSFGEVWYKNIKMVDLFKYLLNPGLKNGRRYSIYSNNGIIINLVSGRIFMRIFTQQLPRNITSLRIIITLITMFGDYDKFKVEAEKIKTLDI